jgi:hypothetical protein
MVAWVNGGPTSERQRSRQYDEWAHKDTYDDALIQGKLMGGWVRETYSLLQKLL